MDVSFLKFWGEFLLQAAEGQRKMEDLTQWMRSGYPPSVDLAALFGKCYDLKPAAASPVEGERWQEATKAFSEALKTYAPLWGWVPLDRYDELKKENDRLQAKLDKQAKLIQRLEGLLADGGMEHMSMLTRFQDLITDQNQAFEKLMKVLSASPKASDKKQT